jgi:hypothetical protein
MNKTLNNNKKWPSIFSVPAIIVLLILAFKTCIWTASIVKYYIGDWGVVLAMPIYFHYIISPIWDELQKWYEDRFC